MTDARGADLYDAAIRELLGQDAEQDIERALALLRSSMQAGFGPAASRLAVLTAVGLAGRTDWQTALDLLEVGALLGDPMARRQLGQLTQDRALAERIRLSLSQGKDVWRRARRGTVLESLLTPPPSVRLSHAPLIEVIRGFASPSLCRWLRRRGQEEQTPAILNDVATGRPRLDPARTNTARSFGLAQTDMVVLLAQARLAAATGASIQMMEPPNVMRYAPGQRFAPHLDSFQPQEPGFARMVEVLGQRVTTALIYLNDDYQGGETDFPRVGVRFKGRAGDALLFRNVRPDGSPDALSLHAGLPTSRGDKWVLSQWIRNRVQAVA